MYTSFIKVESTQTCCSRNMQSLGKRDVKTGHDVIVAQVGGIEAWLQESQGRKSTATPASCYEAGAACLGLLPLWSGLV